MLKLLYKMNKKFYITVNVDHQGSLSHLGMKIFIKSTGILIHQPEYMQKILENYEFDKLNGSFTPMEPGMLTGENNF